MTETTLASFVDRTALKKKVKDGTLDLAELYRLLAAPADAPKPVAKPPLPAVITDQQKEALAKLIEVFGKVVPTEARALTDEEISDLMEERTTLDQIDKLAEARKKEIRTTVLNHLDQDGDGPRDKEGHILTAGRATSPSHGKAFSWEIGQRGGGLDPASLLALVEDGTIDRSVYLEMTTQVRVIDENKVMLALKKHPELIDALGDAVTKTSQVGSLYVRTAK